MFEVTIDFFWVMCLYTIVSEYYYLSESSQSHLCNCSINIVGVKFSQLFLPVYNQKLLKSLLLSSTVPPHTSVALVNILCSLISYLTNFVSGINILQFLAKAPYNLYFFQSKSKLQQQYYKGERGANFQHPLTPSFVGTILFRIFDV